VDIPTEGTVRCVGCACGGRVIIGSTRLVRSTGTGLEDGLAVSVGDAVGEAIAGASWLAVGEGMLTASEIGWGTTGRSASQAIKAKVIATATKATAIQVDRESPERRARGVDSD